MVIAHSGTRYANIRYTRGAAFFVGVVPALLCLAVLVVLILARHSGAHHEDVAIGFWAAAASVFAAVAVRFTRLAIIATPRRLTIRNFWRTRHISWNEIERIEPPPAMKSRPNAVYGQTGPGLRITLTGGRVIIANAFARRKADPLGFADQVIHELQQAIEAFCDASSEHYHHIQWL